MGRNLLDVTSPFNLDKENGHSISTSSFLGYETQLTVEPRLQTRFRRRGPGCESRPVVQDVHDLRQWIRLE